MLEGVFLAARAIRRHEELRLAQIAQPLAELSVARSHRLEHGRVEGAADHGRRLEHGLALRREAIDARHHHLLQRARDVGALEGSRGVEGAVPILDGALVHERAHHLLDVEGIAARALLDQRARGVGDVAAAEQIPDHAPDRIRAERGQRELDAALRVLLAHTLEDAAGGLGPAGAGRGHEEQALLVDEAQQRLEQLDRRAVGPVQIVHHHHERAAPRLSPQQLAHGAPGHALEGVGRHVGQATLVRGVEREALEAQQEGEHLGLERGQQLAHRVRDARALRVAGFLVANAGPAAQQIREGVVGEVPAGGERAALEPAQLARRRLLRDLGHEARLADAGLGNEMHDASAPRRERPERVAEQRHLGLAPDQLGEHAPLHADPGTMALRLARAHLEARRAPVRERLGTAGRVLEHLGGGLVRLGVDVDLAAFGHVGQLVGAVHVLAHHRVLADQRAADVARDALPRRDARVHREARLEAALVVVRLDALAHLDRRVHGRARRVLDRFGDAEQRHRAIPEEVVHRAAVLARDLLEQVERSGHHGIGPRRALALGHGGEPADVGEQHGHAPPLGLARALAPLLLARLQLALRAQRGGAEAAEHEATRAARGALAHQRARLVVERVGRERVEQRVRGLRCERRELELAPARARARRGGGETRARLVPGGTEAEQHEQRSLAEQRERAFEQRQRLGIEEVRVLEGQHVRPARHAVEQLGQRLRHGVEGRELTPQHEACDLGGGAAWRGALELGALHLEQPRARELGRPSELGQQPRLAAPLRPDQRDAAALPFEELRSRLAQPLELALATHHADRAAQLTEAPLLHGVAAQQREGRDGLALALEREGRQSAIREPPPRRLPAGLADVDLARRRLRIQARRGVHDVAEHVELTHHRAADVSRHDLAGVDPRMQCECDTHLAGVLADAPAHLERGARRGPRVVFERQRVAEHAEQLVAAVLVDGAAVLAHHLVENPQARRHDEIGALGPGLAREGREADQVDEDHRSKDLLRACTLGGRRHGSTSSAPPKNRPTLASRRASSRHDASAA